LSLEDAPSFDAAPYFGARVVMSLPFLSEEQYENTKGKQTYG